MSPARRRGRRADARVDGVLTELAVACVAPCDVRALAQHAARRIGATH